MGTPQRTVPPMAVDRALIRDAVAIASAVCVIGLSFGAIAVASGIPVWAVVAMSTLIFAGGSQFMAVGMLAAGSPFAAILGGLLLNARHLPFGLAVADVVGPTWPRRLLGSHLMVDESVAFAMAQSGASRRRGAYWLTGGILFVGWNIGCLAGAYAGTVMSDPDTFGLDAAFPAGLLALLLPSLRRRNQHGRRDGLRVGLAGAVIAVALTPVLPAGLPVLLALGALILAGRS